MDKFGPTLIIAAITLLVFAAMWWGWRRRSRRDLGLRVEHDIPGSLGVERLRFDAFYVATTVHERPLERLAIPGLGFRARAHLTVHDTGIVLELAGEPPVFVAAARIESADRATTTIDRVVEPGGLIRLAWRIAASPAAQGEPGTTVDSYLRPIAPEAAASFLQAITTIAPAAKVSQTQRKRGAA
ncbi:MAG TPA: hypothetical protein VN133_11800 [Humibacter sp.]|nr:hypothetical protein [Humibacter sp.]